MSRIYQKRSRSIQLMLLGTATLLAGCHHAQAFVPDQPDLYQSPDRDPTVPSGMYASESDCIESVGANYCEPVTFVRDQNSMAAVGYESDEVAYQTWPQYLVYWMSRGSARVGSQIIRGGFGHSSARFGGVWV